MLLLPILVQIVQLDSTWSVFNILPSPFFHYLHVIVFIILGWVHIGGACTGRSSCFLVFSLVANGLDWPWTVSARVLISSSSVRSAMVDGSIGRTTSIIPLLLLL